MFEGCLAKIYLHHIEPFSQIACYDWKTWRLFNIHDCYILNRNIICFEYPKLKHIKVLKLIFHERFTKIAKWIRIREIIYQCYHISWGKYVLEVWSDGYWRFFLLLVPVLRIPRLWSFRLLTFFSAVKEEQRRSENRCTSGASQLVSRIAGLYALLQGG